MCIKETFGKTLIHMRGARVPPCAPPVGGRLPRMSLPKSTLHQVLCPGVRTLPLSPEDTAQLAPYPAVEFLENALDLRQLEIVHPAPQDGRKRLDSPGHIAPPALPEYLPQPKLKTLNTRLRNLDTRLVEAITRSPARFDFT